MEFNNINRILLKSKRPAYFLKGDVTWAEISFIDGFIEGLNSAHEISENDYFACRTEIFQAERQLLKI